MTMTVVTRRGEYRVMAVILSWLLVWSSVAPGIAAAQSGTAKGVGPTLDHVPPAAGIAGEPQRVSATVGGTPVAVTLHRRVFGESAFDADPMRRLSPGEYVFDIPTDAEVNTRIEYWIEAADATGTELRAGSAAEPLSIEVVADGAPSADFIGPSIAHAAERQGIAGAVQSFEATVTDNVGIEKVTLFYRLSPEDDFERAEMGPTGDDVYAAEVRVGPGDRTIEYFIEAADTSGTTTARGSRFAPLERDIVAAIASAGTSADEAAAGEAAEPPKSRTLWYVVGGALVVGLIAAAIGGPGPDDDDEVITEDCCDVTFVIDQPQ